MNNNNNNNQNVDTNVNQQDVKNEFTNEQLNVQNNNPAQNLNNSLNTGSSNTKKNGKIWIIFIVVAAVVIAVTIILALVFKNDDEDGDSFSSNNASETKSEFIDNLVSISVEADLKSSEDIIKGQDLDEDVCYDISDLDIDYLNLRSYKGYVVFYENGDTYIAVDSGTYSFEGNVSDADEDTISTKRLKNLTCSSYSKNSGSNDTSSINHDGLKYSLKPVEYGYEFSNVTINGIDVTNYFKDFDIEDEQDIDTLQLKDSNLYIMDIMDNCVGNCSPNLLIFNKEGKLLKKYDGSVSVMRNSISDKFVYAGSYEYKNNSLIISFRPNCDEDSNGCDFFFTNDSSDLCYLLDEVSYVKYELTINNGSVSDLSFYSSTKLRDDDTTILDDTREDLLKKCN